MSGSGFVTKRQPGSVGWASRETTAQFVAEHPIASRIGGNHNGSMLKERDIDLTRVAVRSWNADRAGPAPS
jgi:hypothetical protein